MKFLSVDQMCVLLPAEDTTIDRADRKFNVLLSRADGDKERLKRLTGNGTLQTFQINYASSPAGIVWYRTEDGKFILDTLISVDNTLDFMPLAVEAIKRVAVAKGCHTVEGVASRSGIVKQWMSLGAYPVGVMLRKEL